MFIATARQRSELRQEFNVPFNQDRHFTPEGMTGSYTRVTINISLLPGGNRPGSSTRLPS